MDSLNLFISNTLEQNKQLRKNNAQLQKIIQENRKIIMDNEKKLKQYCEHNWEYQGRHSCYDRVSYQCKICKMYRN